MFPFRLRRWRPEPATRPRQSADVIAMQSVPGQCERSSFVNSPKVKYSHL